MKKLLSIITVLIIVIGIIPVVTAETVSVSADGVTQIISYNFADSSGDIVQEGEHLSFHQGHWTKYTVNAEEAGTYTLYAGIGAPGADIVKISAAVNDGDKQVSVLRATGSYHTILSRFVARVDLQQGENVITITNELSGYYFDYITLEKRENQITDLSLIEAEAYNYGGEAAVTAATSSKRTTVTLSANDWLMFDAEVSADGEYRLEINAASTNDDSFGYLAQNGISCGNFDIRNTGRLTQYGKSVAFVSLSEGRNELKFALSGGQIKLDSFSLVPVNTESKDNFLQAVNSAQSAQDAENAIARYSDVNGIDSETELSQFFYPDPIFSRLLMKEFKTADEVVNSFYDSLTSEASSPTVTAMVGKNQVFEPSSGDMSFYVRTDMLKSPAVVALALYKNNSLYKLQTTECENGAETYYVTPAISGVEIAETDNVSFKLFYLNSLENIKPYDIYPKAYENIYVSSSAEADGDGTKENPFNSIAKAKDKIAEINANQNGDIVVNIEEGYYFLEETEIFSPEHSGKNGYDVILRGSNPENPPVIGGGREVADWQYVSDGIWKASLPGAAGIRNLYIDGKPAARARSEETYSVKALYADSDAAYETDGITVESSGFPTLTYPLETELVWNIEWHNRRAPVEAIKRSDEEYIIFLEPESFSKMIGTDYTQVKAGKKFYIENDLSLLDNPGEFWFDETTDEIYYMPNDESELSKPAYVPVTEGLIEVKGNGKEDKTHNIVFENLDIRYGAWNDVNENGFAAVQADAYWDATSTDVRKMLPAQIKVNMADSIQFKNCTFSCHGSSALAMTDGVTNSSVCGNIIKDVSGTGVVIGTWEHDEISDSEERCRNIEVSNNVIRRIANEYFSSTAISVYYENSVTVSHNDISDIPYTGITVGWGWGAVDVFGVGNINITDNRIVDVMKVMGDGAHIYTLGPLRDSSVSGNYLEKTGDPSYSALYTDSGSAYLNIYKNVIMDCDRWFFTGLYYTHDMNVFENYSTTSTYDKRGENNSYEDAVLITEESIPQAAQAIAENAGVEEKYGYLLDLLS